MSSSANPCIGAAAWRFRTSSQSSSASLPWTPQMPASGSVVVGRRTAAVAISSPLTALKSDDLPLPVAPKKPTTVWSRGQRPPRTRAVEHLQHTGQGLLREDSGGELPGAVERFQPAIELGRLAGGAMTAHDVAASRRSAAAWPAMAEGGTPPSTSSRVKEPLALRRQQALAPQMQVFARGPGEPADGVLPEYCLQEPLTHDGGAAGDSDLKPGQARGHGEHHNHQGGAEAVDAERQPAGLGALALAFGADEFHQAPLPSADLGRHSVREALGGTGKIVGAQHLPAGGV